MLASCLLCIAHKKTTNKEQRLRRNERPSYVTKYWNALDYLEGHMFRENMIVLAVVGCSGVVYSPLALYVLCLWP